MRDLAPGSLKHTAGDINRALTEAMVAVEDAHLERDHWKKSYGLVQAEMRILVGVVLQRMTSRRIVVTEREAEMLDRSQQLYVGNPEPGVRVYELREGSDISEDVAKRTNLVLP